MELAKKYKLSLLIAVFIAVALILFKMNERRPEQELKEDTHHYFDQIITIEKPASNP